MRNNGAICYPRRRLRGRVAEEANSATRIFGKAPLANPPPKAGAGVHATQARRNFALNSIALTAVAASFAAVLMVASAFAEDPRSVTILPDVPEAPEAPPAPDISPVRLELLNSTINVENSAGVSVDLLPRLEVPAGSKIGFRIATRKPGYLILLDVDAAGKITQIFPAPRVATRGLREATNLIKPGHPLTIPQLGTPYAGFEFAADLPAGVAMVVALLSDKPVQVVDLPDSLPSSMAPGDALKYVRDQALTLKIPNADSGRLDQPNWSISGKFYLIK